MQVHTVNADGSTGTSGEMDFLLLDDYAPNNIAAHYDAGQRGLLQRPDVSPHHPGLHDPGRRSARHRQRRQRPERRARGTCRTTSSTSTCDSLPPACWPWPTAEPDTNDCQFFITAEPYRSARLPLHDHRQAGRRRRHPPGDRRRSGRRQRTWRDEQAGQSADHRLGDHRPQHPVWPGDAQGGDGATAGETATSPSPPATASTVTLTGTRRQAASRRSTSRWPPIRRRPTTVRPSSRPCARRLYDHEHAGHFRHSGGGRRRRRSARLRRDRGSRRDQLDIITSNADQPTAAPSRPAAMLIGRLRHSWSASGENHASPPAITTTTRNTCALFIRPAAPASMSITTPGHHGRRHDLANNRLDVSRHGRAKRSDRGDLRRRQPEPHRHRRRLRRFGRRDNHRSACRRSSHVHRQTVGPLRARRS